MLGDILLFESGKAIAGSAPFQVLAGAVGSIKAGEPVSKALGQQYVLPAANNTPVVATDFYAGIAASTSTDTVALDGSVQVYEAFDGETSFLVNPKVPATFTPQATYNALVGKRVLLDLTAGAYTLLAADGATNGCVIEDLDLSRYPGKVRISFRNGVNYLA